MAPVFCATIHPRMTVPANPSAAGKTSAEPGRGSRRKASDDANMNIEEEDDGDEGEGHGQSMLQGLVWLLGTGVQPREGALHRI